VMKYVIQFHILSSTFILKPKYFSPELSSRSISVMEGICPSEHSQLLQESDNDNLVMRKVISQQNVTN